MPRLQIVRIGHPALRAKSKEVSNEEIHTKAFQDFLDNLAVVCVESDGVGIAAPQVGINKRVIAVYVDAKNPRYSGKKPFPLAIIINPRVTEKGKVQKDDWEGDLSCGFRAVVPRATSCMVTGLDRNAKSVTYKLDYDFHARVFQHEIDHLDGKFFIDHVKRYDTISEMPEWKKYWKNKKIT